MADNKIIVRRLPPTMSEDEFLKHVAPLPKHDYFCYFEASSGLGPYSFSRAYINFCDHDEMSIFRERFDNYIFLDKDGHEYSAVVEQSLWHKSPKNGPFFLRNDNHSTETKSSSEESKVGKVDIYNDGDFLEFIDKLQAQKKKPRQSPIQVLESNLEEVTNKSTSSSKSPSSSQGKSSDKKVITPLMSYINKKRSMKGNRRTR